MALAAGVLVLWVVGKFTQGNPANIAAIGKIGKKGLGVVLLFVALVLALRGGIVAAVPVFLLGLSLLGKAFSFSRGMFDWGNRPSGQKSSVRTRMLAMELDHDTGVMDGEVLEGSFKGQRLKMLPPEQLLALLDQLRQVNDQSASLLEAYLDRAHPVWRTWEGARSSFHSAKTGAMSREEAYLVLGLKPGAGTAEIRSAHRRLIKQFHPDHGGSDYIAAKINQAKDLLLG